MLHLSQKHSEDKALVFLDGSKTGWGLPWWQGSKNLCQIYTATKKNGLVPHVFSSYTSALHYKQTLCRQCRPGLGRKSSSFQKHNQPIAMHQPLQDCCPREAESKKEVASGDGKNTSLDLHPQWAKSPRRLILHLLTWVPFEITPKDYGLILHYYRVCPGEEAVSLHGSPRSVGRVLSWAWKKSLCSLRDEMSQWRVHAEILSLRLLQRCLWGWEGGVGFVQGRKHGEGKAAM